MIRSGPLPLLLALHGLLATACEQPPPALTEIVFRVQEDDGARVAGAQVLVDGAVAGTTGDRGEIRTALGSRTDRAYAISHRCPPSSRPVEGTTPLRVERIAPLPGRSPPALLLRRHCAPTSLRHVLLVRTGGRPGLAVRVLGEIAGRTDADGVAALKIDGAPGDEVEVSVDTSGAPRLRPISPSRRLKLPGRRTFFFFDQEFEEKQRPRHGAGRPKHVPKRL
jgi:hypothetical protein